MNRKLVIQVAVVFFILIIPSNHSLGMENGFDAPVDGRTVPIIVEPMGIVCTGFLFSERIVLTAGHCLHNMQSKTIFKYVQIGAPNETFTATSKRIPVVESYVSSQWGNFGWSDDVNFNPTGEFGVYVLKQPIKVPGNVEIASAEKIKQFTAERVLVTNIAYGKQNPTQSYSGLPSRSPKFAQFPLVSLETMKADIENALSYKGKKKYNMNIHVLQLPGGPSTCSGDSGSPLYVKQDETYIYLGPISNGLGGIPNCSGSPWSDTKFYSGGVAAYDYLDLITTAENYVRDNPYVEPKAKSAGFESKTTITCIKGKTTKKVSGFNPKCPAGFKKR
jgi:secreted trypsin-like serine protease